MSDKEFLSLLQEVVDNVDGVRSAALLSTEGLVVQAILEDGISDIKLAAMTATILSVSEKVLKELKSGILDVCILQGNEGNFVVMQAGTELILAVCLNVDARMDMCFIEMRKVSKRIKNIA